MNAFSWFVLACVAVCAVLAVRAMRRAQRRGGCGACAGGCAACPHACPRQGEKTEQKAKSGPVCHSTRGRFWGKNSPFEPFFHIK